MDIERIMKDISEYKRLNDAEVDRLRAELEAARVDAERLTMALVDVYSALESASADGIVSDTIWMPVNVSESETLFDYIDAAIEAARGGK